MKLIIQYLDEETNDIKQRFFPEFSQVAFTGDYNSLVNKPTPTVGKVISIVNTTYSLDAVNKNSILKLTNIADVVITVPKDTLISQFADTDVVYFLNTSAKSVRFVAATGVIIRSEDGALKMAKQNTLVALTRIGVNNEWLLTGNLIK
jgi:hypothetical protein